jgi:hypothetical protein
MPSFTFAVVSFVTPALWSIASAGELSFNRDTRPILSENGFFCHSSDAAQREAELRLDSFAEATRDLGG